MAGQKQINPAARKARHGHLGPAYQVAWGMRIWQIKRMVSNNESENIQSQCCESFTSIFDLASVDASCLVNQRSGSIDPQN
ncbi:MAG: hypothetical protein DMG84_19235, partial [Acidobacteria bacterium]